nr:hypothetical protein CFP56_77210 [Quercus suber]
MYVRPTTSYTSETSAAFQYDEKEVRLLYGLAAGPEVLEKGIEKLAFSIEASADAGSIRSSESLRLLPSKARTEVRAPARRMPHVPSSLHSPDSDLHSSGTKAYPFTFKWSEASA